MTVLASETVEFESAPPAQQWASLSFVCCGVRVRVNAPEPIIEKIPANFIPGSSRDQLGQTDVAFTVSTGEQFEILEDGSSRGIFATWREALEVLEGSAHEAIAARATTHAFVHAGVVAFNGKVILIPGRSYAGKTTLVMALVDAGATYYSDEYALVDAEGSVHPFVRNPRVRQNFGMNVVINDLIPPPLPVGLVVMTKYKPNAEWRPKKLSVSQGLFGLIDNSVGIRSYPEMYLGRLKQLAMTAATYSSVRGDARVAANAILTELLCNKVTTSAEEKTIETNSAPRKYFLGESAH
jgi:hypothetical protein